MAEKFSDPSMEGKATSRVQLNADGSDTSDLQVETGLRAQAETNIRLQPHYEGVESLLKAIHDAGPIRKSQEELKMAFRSGLGHLSEIEKIEPERAEALLTEIAQAIKDNPSVGPWVDSLLYEMKAAAAA